MKITKDLIKLNKKGVSLALSAVVAVIMAILVMSMTSMVQQRSNQMVYFENLDRTYRLSETGLNTVLTRLVADPDFYLNEVSSGTVEGPGGIEGQYHNQITPSDNPVDGAYYVVTTATRTGASGKRYITRLHSIVKVSNVAEYFMAMPDSVGISFGVDISQGKIYAKDLTFHLGGIGTGQTRLLEAEFDANGGSVAPPIPWDATTRTLVDITNGPDPKPVTTRTFPQVLESDIARYLTLATDDIGGNTTDHTSLCIFGPATLPQGHIFPPGYVGGKDPMDDYVGHTDTNYHHVYYCPGTSSTNGDMYIQGIVHGQVLFVAEGNIYISSSVVLHSNPNDQPGAGTGLVYESSSTAHQPVYITRGDVVIDNTFVDIDDWPFGASTQTVTGLVLAPHGTFRPRAYQIPDIHDNLALIFEGSLILSRITGNDPSLPDVFKYQNLRTYRYLDTLRTDPPPFLPALVEIHYSFEETGEVN